MNAAPIAPGTPIPLYVAYDERYDGTQRALGTFVDPQSAIRFADALRLQGASVWVDILARDVEDEA